MTSILPVNRLGAPTGALVVRDGSGNRTIPSAVHGASVFTPPPTFDMDCEETALPDDCTARITPRQVNALVSELLALMVELTPDGSFSCDSVTNLAAAFATWRDALSFSASDISDASVDGRSLITAANMAAIRVLLALGITDIAGLTAALASKEATANKGQANGYAPLDGTSKISSTYLPSYVDDVVEAANYAALPGTGETGKIYVTLDDGKQYRWSGSAYVHIAKGDVESVAALTGVISASDLKTALAIAVADITDASVNGRSLIAAANDAAMRTLLGLGSAALLTAGTSANNLVQLDSSGHLPALDGSNLTNLPAGTVASQADAETGTQNSNTMTALRTSQEIVNRPTSFKNIAGRNGGMEVWQRGTSIAMSASFTAYLVDGWYIKTGANQASTVAQVAGLVPQSQFAAKLQRNSGQTGTGTMYFAMPLDIDELIKLRSGAAVLSFQVSTGANWSPTSGTLTYNLYCGTGAVAKRGSSAYTSETNPITGTVNLTTNQAATQVISAVSSAIGSGITQAEIQFSWTPTGTAGANDWFAIDDVQLEIVPTGVSAVTPKFERTDYADDLRRCMRFYEQLEGPAVYGAVDTTYGSITHWHFKARKRSTPTIVAGSGSAWSSIVAGTDSLYATNIATQYTFIHIGTSASSEI